MSLAEADEDNKEAIQAHIEKHNSRKQFYHDLSAQLEQSGEVQISKSDPDSRKLITRNNITEVAYNVQTTVDEQNKLVLDYKVSNTNDSKAMAACFEELKSFYKPMNLRHSTTKDITPAVNSNLPLIATLK